MSAFALMAASRFAGAAPVVVPDDYATIQEAIDAVSTGGEVVVRANVYQENLLIGGKDFTLRSTDPLDPTVIAATVIEPSIQKPIVRFSNTETSACLISGLTFRNGYVSEMSSYDNYGGAINGGSRSPQAGAGAKATLDHCVFTSNTAETSTYGHGGAIWGFDGVIRDCVFLWNDGGREGGAIAFSNARIENCWFEGNTARDGGALNACKGGVHNSVFIDNTASTGYGGGMANCSISYNNVFYGNHAGLRGGGIGLTFNVKNCIVTSNTAVYGALIDDQINQVSFPENCCIQDLGHTNWGNITAEPRYVDPNNGDFHLQSDSPCIDAGGAFSGMSTIDFDGDSRGIDVVDDPRGDGSNVDIGVDEYVGVSVRTLRDHIIGGLHMAQTTLEDGGVDTSDGVDVGDLVERVNTGP